MFSRVSRFVFRSLDARFEPGLVCVVSSCVCVARAVSVMQQLSAGSLERPTFFGEFETEPLDHSRTVRQECEAVGAQPKLLGTLQSRTLLTLESITLLQHR